MKISFLVTYYNQEQFVRNSLDSILAIDKPDEWEILVGDDGSSDGTREIVQEYINQDPEHIHLLVMPREQGVRYDPVQRASANRLNLLQHSTGEYFCTLDGDDYYTDTSFVQDALKIFSENEGISLVAFGFGYYQDGQLLGSVLLPVDENQRIDTDTYLQKWYIHSGACVYRNLWGRERTEYLKNLGAFDDNDIVLNSLNFGDMFFVKKNIYAYRQTGESVYTSMDLLGKFMLNAYAYDLERYLIEKEYHSVLQYRFRSSILGLYVWRKRIDQIVNRAKKDYYLEQSSKLPESITYRILTGEKEEETRKEIGQLIRKDPKLYTIIRLSYLKRRWVTGVESV